MYPQVQFRWDAHFLKTRVLKNYVLARCLNIILSIVRMYIDGFRHLRSKSFIIQKHGSSKNSKVEEKVCVPLFRL